MIPQKRRVFGGGSSAESFQLGPKRDWPCARESRLGVTQCSARDPFLVDVGRGAKN